jgi:methyl-accepting chemotaxis protein
MKISHRLIALSAFSAAGLLCVAGVSYLAVTSIQSDLRGLTLQATPLQNKTYEMQERTERLMGSLLRLTLAKGRDDVDKASVAIKNEIGAIDRIGAEIGKLDPRSKSDSSEFQAAQAEITRAVEKRLADEAAYRSETESARAALQKAEAAIAVTRSNVAEIGTEAGKAADRAQDASRRLANATKLALLAQAKLKDIAIVVNEVDAASNRFRLTPLKEKVKAAADSIQRLEAEAGSEDVLKEAKAVAAGLVDAFNHETYGLLALRAAVLTKQADADANYQKQRKAVLGPLEEQAQKLGALTDTVEVQTVKQRQTLEAALRLRNEPGGVVAVSEDVSLGMREMVGGLRLLMLAGLPAEANAAEADIRKLGDRLVTNMNAMRAGVVKMGRPQLGQNVDGALAAMASVTASVAKVAAAKKSLLDSEASMNTSLAKLKTVAAQKASLGEQQVKTIADRQAEVIAGVDHRVDSSLMVILGIAGAIIAVSAALSWRTVRSVTRSLDRAVKVAEAVSRGELQPVAQGQALGNDETARLLAALGSMVHTLTGVVTNIRSASEAINAGSKEIAHGNRDLSDRTEDQSSSLQQTAASVQQLSGTVKQNADTAREATALARSASEVAGRGGQAVGDVVATMSEIETSSKRIADIIGVIDSIAFQTNILALNAAVEAARAGEHGRGFAVVASEVRGLAQKSAQAARQIKDIIVASVERIDTGSRQVRNAGATMGEIVAQVHKVNDLIAEIARASEEQSESVTQVNSAVTRLDTMTQSNAALAEQGTAAAVTLSQQAHDLAAAISVFSLADSAQPEPA